MMLCGIMEFFKRYIFRRYNRHMLDTHHSTVGSTFITLLRDRAQRHPERVAFTFLKRGETPAHRITYGELDRRARAIATSLQTRLSGGDRVLLVYPYDAGIEFIAAFLGCLYAGVVAVPSHPPRNRYAFDDLSARFRSADTQTILTPTSLRSPLQRQFAAHASGSDPSAEYDWRVPEAVPDEAAVDWKPPILPDDALAFLQYTSGSTGAPKGVRVTHRSLLHNQRQLQMAFGHTEELVGLGWLPLFHDMGLIGNVLQTLYMGTACVLMSPIDFIQKPVRWLNAVSHYGVTTSGGPNFAYDLLCRYVTEAQSQTLDLSRWTVAFTGAEPVRPATLDAFVEKFGPCGFRREAFYPCYGMAEATLFISGGNASEPPKILQVDEKALTQNRVEVVNAPASYRTATRTLVSCGYPWLGSAIAIADPDTGVRCPPGQIGEIWVSGDGLGDGYWRQPQETEHTFRAFLQDTGEGPFMRTGDLGFVQDGELYITGRLHDVLVFWGLNHYPQHIEQTVQRCHPSFRADGGAAFSIKVNGDDRLVVVQEVERRDRQTIALTEVVEPIRWAVFQEHLIDVQAIVLLPPGALPKTPSGKVQRQRCRHQFLDGSLKIIAEWRSPSEEPSDIPTLVRRYFNPLVHLKRYGARLRTHWRRSLHR